MTPPDRDVRPAFEHRVRRSRRWPPGNRWDPYDRGLSRVHEELLLRRLVSVEADLRELAGLCGSPERSVAEAVARAAAEVESARDALLARRPDRSAELEALMAAAVAQAEERLGSAFVRLSPDRTPDRGGSERR